MQSPRGRSLQHGDFTVHDLRREESPGPGAYDGHKSSLSNLSPRVGKSPRRTGEYLTREGNCAPNVTTPGPAQYNIEAASKLTMKHSASASARMLSPRFSGFGKGELTVHDP